MTQLIILGAGGHGAVVAEAALLSNNWKTVAFLDDNVAVGTDAVDCPVLGDLAMMSELLDGDNEYFVAVGDNQRRAKILASIEARGAPVANVIHPDAVVSPSAKLEHGIAMCARAVINARAKIGCGSIINTGASVDHDCELGRCVHVSPGANLGGCVIVGDKSWIGIGSAVKEGISIGSNCIVGAGSAVISDVGSGIIIAGVPAKRIADG